MAKVLVCDKCRMDKGKLTETNRYTHVPGHPDLRMDLCGDCNNEFHTQFGKKITPEYVQEVYRLHGMKIDRDLAAQLLHK